MKCTFSQTESINTSQESVARSLNFSCESSDSRSNSIGYSTSWVPYDSIQENSYDIPTTAPDFHMWYGTNFDINNIYKPSANNAFSGWKIHISVHQDDLGKAWEIFGRIMDEQEIIPTSKIIRKRMLEEFDKENCPQRGKMITIYDHNENINWEHLLSSIEQSFCDAKIRSSFDVLGDNKIKNSKYLSYRNETDHNNKYISMEKIQSMNIEESQRYNPFNKKEKFNDIDNLKYYENNILRDVLERDHMLLNSNISNLLIKEFYQPSDIDVLGEEWVVLPG